MTITLLLLKKIISLFLIMLCGAVLVRVKILKSDDSAILSKISLYLITPCTIINAFQIEFTEEIMKDLLLSLGTGVVLLIFLVIAGRILRGILHLDPVEETSIIYSNAGNLIIPLVTSVFGPEWVIFTSPYMCFQIFLLWTHGKAVICQEKGFDLKKLATNINLIAVVIGILMMVFKISLPGVLGDTVETLGSMIGPMAMLVTGMLIGGMQLKKVFTYRRVWMVTFFRLIGLPLIMFVLIKVSHAAALSANGDKILLISFLASISCAASTVTQMAQVYGRDAEYASAINVVTTLGCMITMPLLVFLFQL